MSCSLRGCGFGKVQAKSMSTKTGRGRKSRSRKSKSKKSFRRKSKSRKSRKRRFGFKYLRNDQIINSVFHNYPVDLTCDRA